MDRFEKVATPATAASMVVPDSFPLLGLVLMPMVIVVVALVTVFPNASRMVTCTGGWMIVAATVLLGWPVKTIWLAAAGPMVKLALVAAARPPDVAVRV